MKKIFLLLYSCFCFFCEAQTVDPFSEAKGLLQKGKPVSDILTNPRFDSIRTETAFRELIKTHASQGSLQMTAPQEPGAKIIVQGKLYNAQHAILANTLIYVYQTDTRGWYGSDRVHFQMLEGDRRHARLFGYLKTDAKGRFEIHTIQPHGYPGSDLPAHIHFEVFEGERALLISELLFDDDERLQGEIRKRAMQDGFFISKPETSGAHKTYNYNITISH